jgi:hypothetical protein
MNTTDRRAVDKGDSPSRGREKEVDSHDRFDRERKEEMNPTPWNAMQNEIVVVVSLKKSQDSR